MCASERWLIRLVFIGPHVFSIVEVDNLENFPETSLEIIFKTLGLLPLSTVPCSSSVSALSLIA